MNDKKAIECIKKLKEHCCEHSSNCVECSLKSDNGCFVRTVGGIISFPLNWQIPSLKPQLTDVERVILCNRDKRFKWIARDEDGTLCIYVKEPQRNDDMFSGGNEESGSFPNLFRFIKWEDEPYLIEDLLKE